MAYVRKALEISNKKQQDKSLKSYFTFGNEFSIKYVYSAFYLNDQNFKFL